MKNSLLIALLLATAPVAVAAPAPSHEADLDRTCSPCRDFDRFANGGWKQRTPIPAGYSNYGAFEEVYDRNEAVLRDVLDAALRGRARPGSDEARLSDYYGTCLDSTGAERLGVSPVAGLLMDMQALASASELPTKVAWLHDHGIGALFSCSSAQDPRQSTSVIATLGQAGLGLPDRDYYLRTDSASAATREVYRRTTANLLRLAGESEADAQRHADAVLELETQLARSSMTMVQRRDPKAVYHRMAWDSLQTLAPGFDWSGYTRARRVPPSEVNVTQPEFARAVGSLAGSVPLDTWRAYLRVRVLRDAAPVLSSAFVDEWFALRRALTGATEMLPRWKRCIAETDESLGEILGREYVARVFTPADKARMKEMVRQLRLAQGERIDACTWMGDSTRTAALGKLDKFAEKIGYPDEWKDYSKVTIRRGRHWHNRDAARVFEVRRNLDRIGRPVDRMTWSMTPPTVNAYYSPSLNSINFPAGILQPPFFDANADDATNYGAIGAVIGHEMGHGFDDRGRQFDPEGNLRDWWTAADVERYKVQADQVRRQFDGYTVLDTLRVNGSLTLGENLADLGGLAVAYAAMKRAYADRPRDTIGGFTPEQRFFLGWARVWRNLQTDADLRTQVQTDPHSPPQWRINGPLSNLREFQDAFGCQGGDPMVRPEGQRARIW